MSFRAYRVFLDANIWFKYLVAQRRRLSGTAVQHIVELVQPRADQTLQLIVSHELLDTLGRVLDRQAVPRGLIGPFLDGLIALSAAGPEAWPPHLTFGGGTLPMRDREDAGIMACCIGAGVDLLVTDNLDDFATNDTVRLDTQRVKRADGGWRKLYTLVYERVDDVDLVVMHPLDVIEWFRQGKRPTADAVRMVYDADVPE